ncbi:MAG: hypothetical protein ACE5J9_07255 [Methanosarcinales archaeon]
MSVVAFLFFCLKDFVDSNAKELSEKLHTSENRIKKWQKNAIYKEVEG